MAPDLLWVLPLLTGSLGVAALATDGQEAGTVPNDGGIPRARPSLGKARCEASSDGVFSIAATLLVFDIAVHPPDTPLQRVVDAWPTYLAYLISFLTVGGAWLGHTDQLTN